MYTLTFFVVSSIYVHSCSTPSFSSPANSAIPAEPSIQRARFIGSSGFATAGEPCTVQTRQLTEVKDSAFLRRRRRRRCRRRRLSLAVSALIDVNDDVCHVWRASDISAARSARPEISPRLFTSRWSLNIRLVNPDVRAPRRKAGTRTHIIAISHLRFFHSHNHRTTLLRNRRQKSEWKLLRTMWWR